jgi:hypothetical protein
MEWRDLELRPCCEAQAVQYINDVINEQIERLQSRVTELEQRAELERAEAADRASFDLSPEFERFHRHQASLGRELLRTIETLRRLRLLRLSERAAESEDTSALGDMGEEPPGELTPQDTPCVSRGAPVEEGLPAVASASSPATQPREFGEAEPTCSTTECRGLHPVASASTAPTQPRGEIMTATLKGENATIKANLESTKAIARYEVASIAQDFGRDDQTQIAGVERQPEPDAAGVPGRAGDRCRPVASGEHPGWSDRSPAAAIDGANPRS